MRLKRNQKLWVLLLLALLLSSLSTVAASNWVIGSNWGLGSNWSLGDTYSLTASIVTPTNTTYTASIVSYNVTVSGNDTVSSYQINAYKAGVPVGSNLTSAIGTFYSLTNGSYTFACKAIGVHGAVSYVTRMFSVAAPDTYTLGITINTPSNITYTSSSVSYSVSPSGNETGLTYQINMYKAGVAVGANKTSSTGTFNSLINGSYNFFVTVTGTHSLSAVANRYLTVAIPPNTWPIVASSSSGGSITPSGTVNVVETNNQTFSFTPNTGYHISNLVVDGSTIAAASSYTFTNVVAAHTIVANFAINTSYILASADANCAISPSGTVSVNYGDDQTFSYSANSGYSISSVTIDGVTTAISSPSGTYVFSGVIANHTISVASSPLPTAAPTPTPTAGPTATPQPNIHNHPLQTLGLYMRSDTYNFSTLSAYGLDTDYTNSYIAIPVSVASDNASVTYGFRVYIASSATVYSELTSGSPEAQLSLSGNFTGQLSTSFNCPDTVVVLGSQVLKIDVYAKADNGSWTIQGSFISNALMTQELMPATWTFTLNLQMTQLTGNTTSIFSFGDSDHRSGVSGVTVVTPNYTDIQGWQFMHGDIIGLILGSYLHILGPIFYVIVALGLFGSLFLRHRNFGPIILVISIFGTGTGLSMWFFLDPIYAAVVSLIVILATASMIFKVIR